MAPKSTPGPAKQVLIFKWMQKSGIAHSIKDLEKALPSVASINGMQVKDYLQALQDESKIRVEKIGSGNWYWSFPSEEKRQREAALEKIKEEKDKVLAAIAEIQEKVDAAEMERDAGEMLMGLEESRASLMQKHFALLKEVENLEGELASHSENDPVEVEKVRQQTANLRALAEKWTEHVLSIEGWVKENTGSDRDQIISMKRQWYGVDFDEEEDGLRELN